MKNSGYYRFPTINGDKVAFISENDLWIISLKDSSPKRLTANMGYVRHPYFSPDGKFIAFVAQEDGESEIYIISSNGGQAKKITHIGSNIGRIACWKEDRIYFASDYGQAFGRIMELFWVCTKKGGLPVNAQYGIAHNISFGNKGVVIGRNTADPARWKRYRGGTAGEIWIDANNDYNFKKLINLKSNAASPMWIKNRIYFLSDHDGIGNIYSVLKSGKSLKKHTDHKNYYARNASSDGNKIVYHAGGDLYIYNINSEEYYKIKIDYYNHKAQISRKFVNPEYYLEDYSTNNDISQITFIARGKAFVMGNWNGAVKQIGDFQGVRYQYVRFLNDKNRIILVSDKSGEPQLEIYKTDQLNKVDILDKVNLGRPYNIIVSPKKDQIVVVNHKHEFLLIDLKTQKTITFDRSKHHFAFEADWSPDGRYIAYSCSFNSRVSIIKIYDIKTKKSYPVSQPILNDYSPKFDPSGQYLAFLSERTFNPVYDSLQFELSFPRADRPYVVMLRKDIDTPLIKKPEPLIESPSDSKEKEKKGSKKKQADQTIDFQKIQDRIVALPVSEGQYSRLEFLDNKVFYLSTPIEGSRQEGWYDLVPPSKSMIKYFDFNDLEEKVFCPKVTTYKTTPNNKALIVQSGSSIRILPAQSPPSKDILSDSSPGKKTGIIDISRAKIAIEPIKEWKQMYAEAWRLQRDYFWVKNMSKINWKKVFNRYFSLIDRLGTRSEFSDLIWEMQGELGTSHAYEFGGDYQPTKSYYVGYLGANFIFDQKVKKYKIEKIIKGDVWDHYNTSPLYRPGVNVQEGMYITHIDGVKLSNTVNPYQALTNKAGSEVQLRVLDKNGKKPRFVSVKTIYNEVNLRYRDWVEHNRDYVHKKTKGKIGYVHIPDMGPDGFAEFHRYFLSEIVYDGLIVDVRYNGGGHVSQLILEKLARKRIGFDLTRWMGAEPYPGESVAGPILAITNEFAGSDGDIFSHSFKLMKLGKLIGKRTWGGVIGIWPRNSLVDGTITTQPEFSFWFKDVGWDVENYGTDVNIEVDITPEDYSKNIDTQLDRAIHEVLKDLKKNPVQKPKFDNKPNLSN